MCADSVETQTTSRRQAGHPTDDRIGRWVLRTRASTDRRLGVPHVVESVIADRPVTRCGRTLLMQRGTRFDYQDVPAIRPCEVCEP